MQPTSTGESMADNSDSVQDRLMRMHLCSVALQPEWECTRVECIHEPERGQHILDITYVIKHERNTHSAQNTLMLGSLHVSQAL